MGRTRTFDEGIVLDRAAELFQRRGYEATSLSDLENHLGIGRQSLYNAFGDKRELFIKSLARYIEGNRARLEEGLAAPDAALPEIVAYFEGAIEALSDEGRREACFVVSSILEVAPGDAHVAKQCSQSHEAVQGALGAALANAQRLGQVSASLDITAAAGLLATHMYGLSVRSKAGADANSLRSSTRLLLEGLEAS